MNESMVKPKNTTSSSNVAENNNQCLIKPKLQNKTLIDLEDKNYEFDWSEKEINIMLSAFFYGYIITQIPGGWLSLKIGGKNTATLTILLGSFFTLLFPLATKIIPNKTYLAILVRFFTGLFHGAMFPSLGSLWVNWLPENERSRLIGFAVSGSLIGSTVSLSVSGILCEEVGWPSIFYIFGVIGILWSFLFWILNSESPTDHRCISTDEIHYILKTTNKNVNNMQLKTPWKAIFTSKICLTLNLCCFCINTGNYLYLTKMPTYINEVLKFDLKSNGFMSCLPYILSFFVINTASILNDYLLKRKLVSKTVLRKIYTGIALVIPSICLLALYFVTCENPYLGVFLLAFGYAITGFAPSGGCLMNLYEIAGPFSSILIGITNTIGTIPGMITPLIVGELTKNKLPNGREWSYVFILTASLYLIGFFAYLIWGDSDLQPWAQEKKENNEVKEMEKKLIN